MAIKWILIPIKFFFILIFLGASFLLSSVGMASEPDREMASCSAVKDSVRRLKCFDDLSKKRGVSGPSVKNTSAGIWEVQTEVSKLDDSKNIYLSVSSKESISGKYGRSHKPTLTIGCRENNTLLWVNANEFVTTKEIDITYRIDKQEASTISLKMATNNEVFGIWRGHNSIEFIKSLFDHNSLLVRYIPYGENPVTVEFPISGLRKAIEPLAQACGWKTA